MSSYISSNANRFYTVLENSYGQVGSITSDHRIPALKLTVQQQLEKADRKDKTGSRTFGGVPWGGRRRTNFELRTYLTTWQPATGSPAYGPLLQAALGANPASFSGGAASSSTQAGRLTFTAGHGLSVGQAVSAGGEIRFVAAIVDPTTVQLNAPFTAAVAPGGFRAKRAALGSLGRRSQARPAGWTAGRHGRGRT